MARNISRDMYLKILLSMDVQQHTETTQTAKSLKGKVDKALDAAQSITSVMHGPNTIEFGALEQWATGSVGEAIERYTLGEAWNRLASPASGVPTTSTQTEDRSAFMSLRYIVSALGEGFDRGKTEFILADPNQSNFAVQIRVVEVKRFDDKTPILMVRYRDGLPTEGKERRDPVTPEKIPCGILAQVLLLQFLELNAPRIPKAYRQPRSRRDQGFERSFILPICAIRRTDIATLSVDRTCVVCGKTSGTRCDRCHLVPYCSQGCLEQDLPNHRLTCQDLRGATWEPYTFTCREGFTTILNAHDPVQRDPRPEDHQGVIPNKHGENPFIIKVQFASTAPSQLLMYDRKGEGGLRALIMREFNSQAKYDRLCAVGLQSGYRGPVPMTNSWGWKVYLWAKRTGDWELDVSLNKLPAQNQPW